MAEEQSSGRRYSPFHRPFRLQLSAYASADFEAPASRGLCQYVDADGYGCDLFEWSEHRSFCRDHWLLVHGVDHLPERSYGS